MALENPIYIDAEARHMPSVVRLLSYAAVEGQEGVLGETQLAVTDLDTPGGSINVAPGGYSILARHIGGDLEAYVGKILTQETVSVNPTSSGGPRTDLVVVRVENPYVTGAGVWNQPPDPLNGPYVHVRVIEGVPANTNSVRALSGNWEAITLARITRPASTGIVQQSHITDLRSLAKLGGQRVIVIDDPPVDPPPIAQEFFFDIKTQSGSEQTLPTTYSGTWIHFPTQADWNIPIPSWACGADILFSVANVRLEFGGATGDYRININNGTLYTPIAPYDLAHAEIIPGWERHPIFAAGTVLIPSNLRGKTVRFKPEAMVSSNDPGVVRWAHGTQAIMQIVFKRFPIAG